MQQIRPRQLADWLSDDSRNKPVLLDVREPWEFELCHIAGSVLVPMRTIPLRLGELDPARRTVVICHHGARSQNVALFLERSGFERVANIAGGINAWSGECDPAVPRY